MYTCIASDGWGRGGLSRFNSIHLRIAFTRSCELHSIFTHSFINTTVKPIARVVIVFECLSL